MSKKIPIALITKGGKAHIAEWIISFIPFHDSYVEPFARGASVLINKTPVAKEIYNDLDSEMVNLFRVLRDNGEKLRELLFLTPYAREEYDEALIYDEKETDLEKARKTVVKAMFSFNGKGFRAVGNNNTSIARSFINYTEADLRFVINRLKHVTIENQDAFKLIKKYDTKKTFYYIDPPYLGTDDYEHNLSEEQHIQLADIVSNLEGMVIVSGYKSELYDKLYPSKFFRRVERQVNVGSFKMGSTKTECLWISRNTPCGLFPNTYEDNMGGGR